MTSQHRRALWQSLILLLLLLLAVPCLVESRQPLTTAEDFRRASGEDKRFVMIEITLHRSSLTSAHMVEIIGAALNDANPVIRGAALSATKARAGGPWIARGDARVSAWERDHGPLQTLRPAIFAALMNDPDIRVRKEGVGALVSLDFERVLGQSNVLLGETDLRCRTIGVARTRLSEGCGDEKRYADHHDAPP